MPIYHKPVHGLMKEMVKEILPTKGQLISTDKVRSWFRSKYPLIKQGTISAHLIRMSVNARSRTHYKAKSPDDDLFFQVDGSHFRQYEKENDPTPITISDIPSIELPEESSDETQEGTGEFAYERDLRNYISKNLDTLESGLSLYDEEGINGIEFPVGGRFIDILAVDRDNNYVVIELKVSRGYDRVVGQIRRYIGWIKKNHAEASETVRGIIIARDISQDLLLACMDMEDISLYEYSLSVAFNKVQDVQ